MKKVLVSLIALTSAALITSSAVAESGWIVTAKVIRVVGTINGGINVRLSPELTSCVSQSGYGPNYASLYPSHAGKDKIASILLAAYLSEKPVAIYLTDSNCTIGEVELGGRAQ
ncbi:MAG: hypothetical protein V4631_11340 [Pseudomonadota bacterium]